MSTSLLPEPLPKGIVMDPLASSPEPKPVKKRVSWTQAEVVALVQSHAKSPANLADLSAPGRTHAECVAKVIALGLVEKPQKATLDADKLADTHTRLADLFEEYVPEQREMAVRHVIKELQSMLPKRPAK